MTAQISPINFSGSGRVLKLSWEIWAVLPSAHSLLSHIIYSHLPHRGGPTFAKSSSSPPSASLLCDLSPSVQCIDFCLRTCKAAAGGEKFCTKIAMSRRVIEASKPSDRSCLWSLRSSCTLEISHLHLHQWPACLLVADTFQSLREVIPKLKASSMYVVAQDLIAMSLAHWLKGMRTDIKANLCSTGLRSTSLNWHCSTGTLLPGSRTGITGFYWSFEIFWCIE